jgi:hypothetical protein
MERIRAAARATAIKHFDLKNVLLPRWLRLFDDLINRRRPVPHTVIESEPGPHIKRKLRTV